MAGQERAKLFGDDDFNPDDWAIENKPKRPRPDRQETEEAARRAGFRKRDAVEAPQPAAPTVTAPATVATPQRRRRTGRNVQFNIKTRAETIETFTRIADANGWGLGETFERATELLARECTMEQDKP